MRVLVTGGSGFIGRYVCEQLVYEGHTPLVLDHERNPPIKYDVLLGDVRDDVIVTEAAAHVDGIIHLAAVLGTQETISNPRPSAITNILGSLNVFEAAAQYDLPVVYIGVGNHWMRIHGTGAYTISKTAAEDFARMFNAYRNGRITIVRPVNAYGPGQSVAAPFGTSKVRKITPSFICRALCGMPIEVYGSGDQVSDMVYVEDVAKVLVAALGSGEEGPIECGPPTSVTVNQMAKMVAGEVAIDTEVQVPIEHLPMRPGEVPDAVVKADTSTLKLIGLDADDFVPLNEGIRSTVQWFIENEGLHWKRPD